jgi:hypothetical protein
MTSSIHNTGKVVLMDSGFCVLDGIIELKMVGVYGSSLINDDNPGQLVSMVMQSTTTFQQNRLDNVTHRKVARMDRHSTYLDKRNRIIL